MKKLVLCVTLNFLLFINTVHSAVKIETIKSAISFSPDTKLELVCNVTFDSPEEKPDIEWLKEGKKVTEIDSLKSRAKPKWNNTQNILTIEESDEEDAGNYTCSALVKGETRGSASITAAMTIAVKIPKNVNVIEGEPMRIECKVFGNPQLSWVFQNETYSVSADRVKLENYTDEGKVIVNGVFIIEEVTKEDRGNVSCIGRDPFTNEEDIQVCLIRVRDKYAALWPFLGICAEVIVLCAIIVIYEKKRNKTELEESDTDQSPDQKNTPDHGKEANLRHRQ